MTVSPSSSPRYRGLTARDLALIALFAALLAAMSLVPGIPVGSVPITLQTLIVMLAPAILGAKRGVLAIATFLALALAGLPILSGGGEDWPPSPDRPADSSSAGSSWPWSSGC